MLRSMFETLISNVDFFFQEDELFEDHWQSSSLSVLIDEPLKRIFKEIKHIFSLTFVRFAS